jgi:antitoxin PrlF
MIATLTSKGQITVPKKIRENLHLAAGDKVDFRVSPNGTVELVRMSSSIDVVFGCLSAKVKNKLSIEDINTTIAQRFKNFQ